MVKGKKVVWDELARAALRVAYNHIREDSPKKAEKVKQEIIATTRKLECWETLDPDFAL